MAAVTNNVAIRWCNEHARRVADLFVQLYLAAKAAERVYVAHGIAAALGDDPGAVVADGSGPSGDGRVSGTKAEFEALLSHAEAFVATAEANAGAVIRAMTRLASNPG